MSKDIVLSGDCSTNYIEVKTGSVGGRVVEKICSGTSASLKTLSNHIFIRFTKGSLISSFNATWTSEELQCCSKIVLENHENRNGEYRWNEASKAYQLVGLLGIGKDQFLFRDLRYDFGPIWGVGTLPTPTSRGAHGLYTNDVTTCPEDIQGLWKYWNGEEFLDDAGGDAVARCAD